MDQWKKELDKCRCIFLRAPKYNQQIFFSGRSPVFTKIDTRIRHIPFITHRPTFNETKRVHILLKTLELYSEYYLQQIYLSFLFYIISYNIYKWKKKNIFFYFPTLQKIFYLTL